jgi:hypothetical protein
MFYMANKLGAFQAGGDSVAGRVQFKLFFPAFSVGHDPQVQAIRVAGDFQSAISANADWDFARGFVLIRSNTADGTFWSYTIQADLPAGYYQYKYLVTFDDGSTRIVSDPCARYGGIENQNAAFVIGGSQPETISSGRLRAGASILEI